MTVDDISRKITSSYPFNETIVIEGIYYEKIQNGGFWKQQGSGDSLITFRP